jgi:hypothetical protein
MLSLVCVNLCCVCMPASSELRMYMLLSILSAVVLPGAKEKRKRREDEKRGEEGREERGEERRERRATQQSNTRDR